MLRKSSPSRNRRLPGSLCRHLVERRPGVEHAAGHGEDALRPSHAHGLEPENSVWQLVTEISKNGIVAARTCAIYETTDVGDLLLTLAGRPGSPEGQTTQYAYDQCGRLRTETAPDGSGSATYDLYGRLLSQDGPWAESGRRITRYTYACSGEADFSNEPATEQQQTCFRWKDTSKR